VDLVSAFLVGDQVADLVSMFFCLTPGGRPVGLRQIFVGNLVCDLVSDKFDLVKFRFPKKVRDQVRDQVTDLFTNPKKSVDLSETR